MAEIERRRAASRRLLALADGNRDPMVTTTLTDEISYSLAGCRAALAHLRAAGLANDDTADLMLAAVSL